MEGKYIECLIIPPQTENQNPSEEEIGLIFDPNVTKGTKYYFTHEIDSGGEKVRARLKRRIKGSNELIDPFDYVGNEHKYSMYMSSFLQWIFNFHTSHFCHVFAT